MLHKGVAAAPGIAIGPVLLFDSGELKVVRTLIKKEEAAAEIVHFQRAIEEAKNDVLRVKDEVLEKLGSEHAKIFEAHLLILEDQIIIERTEEEITVGLKNAGYAFDCCIQEIILKLQDVQDEYLKDRIVDIHDVRRRILRLLVGANEYTLADLKTPVVVVAHELTPTDTAQMRKELILGVITESGGRTSHAAILARALEIPSVIGITGAMNSIPSGAMAVVDGNTGDVVVNPDKRILKKYQQEQRRFNEFEKQLQKFSYQPAVTEDGREVAIRANIELPFEMHSAANNGARGVGLFRTEFLYLTRTDLPSEEEQFAIYDALAAKMAPDPVVIRTFDLGGDKFVHGLGKIDEKNPFLGWRSIRISLEREDVFRVQLRAILRASVRGNVKIMFPMISCLEELVVAKEILRCERDRLVRQGIPCDMNMAVGTMIEVPSAALITGHLAQECDFISIGTNDLIQYTLAVDRSNEKIAHLFEELHPAVLSSLHNIIEEGHQQGVKVSVCGEMAGNPAGFLILLGMGVDEFSMSPVIIPEMKKLITSVTFQQVYYVVNKILGLATVGEIKSCIHNELHSVFDVLPYYDESSLLQKQGYPFK